MTGELQFYQAPGLGPSTTPLPERFYVFVNEQAGVTIDPSGTTVVQHNLGVMNGRLMSVSLVPAYSGGNGHQDAYGAGRLHWRMDMTDDPLHGGTLSPFVMRRLAGRAFQLELDAETARSARHGLLPSRLAGLFAFGSLDDCHEAIDRHGWPLDQVRAFRPGNILRAVRLDMEITTIAEGLYSNGILDSSAVEQFWDTYWSGGIAEQLGPSGRTGDVRSPLWEWLIDGELLPDDR
jgi:hypothetical protein